SSLFPSTAGGYCCDSVVIYVASINRFVWVLQYWPKDGQSLYRIASQSPQQLVATKGVTWNYWDLTSTAVGPNAGPQLDYPSLGFSDNYLYLTFNDNAGVGAAVRVPLQQLVSGNALVPRLIRGSSALHIGDMRVAQNSDHIAYFANLDSNNLYVYTWPEDSK